MPEASRLASSPTHLLAPETLGGATHALTAAFRRAGLDSPELDARRLVLGVLALDSAALLREPERRLSEEERAQIARARDRRLGREPVSRILGWRAFHGLDLEIAPSTLDPRPETETLVDGVLRLVEEGRTSGGGAPRILDVGTGSGAILVALLHRLPRATGLGVDISENALAVANRNAARHGLSHRAAFQRTSWLDDVAGPFDLIVSNPPYIPSSEIAGLEPEVRDFDPISALDGGTDGLEAYRAIARGSARLVPPRGWLAVEVGAGQSGDVARILSDAFSQDRTPAQVWPDLGGIDRCVAIEARA
ncbi:MAG: peptide chain release factor N(5)-glutamine methyltransferase [Hyphomicrobiaceae bacterium]